LESMRLVRQFGVGIFILVFVCLLYFIALRQLFSHPKKFNHMRHSDSLSEGIFQFEVNTIEDKVVSLSKYRGKNAYLVVNVASA